MISLGILKITQEIYQHKGVFLKKKKDFCTEKQNNQTFVSCTDVAQVNYVRSFHKGSYKAGVDLVVNAVWWRAHSKKQSKGFWLLAMA